MQRSLLLENNTTKPKEFVDKNLLYRKKKVLAQQVYCKAHKLPNFAMDGRCYGCGANVFDFVTLEEASSSLITGCPNCHTSFCD